MAVNREDIPEARKVLLTAVLHDGVASPPNYARVVNSLTNSELLDEVVAGKGDPAYQDAVRAQLAERGLKV